jgi:hypothetical protein
MKRSPEKRPITPGYIIFYLLYSADTYRIIAGLVFSVLLTPSIAPPELQPAGRLVLYVMVAAIGWAITAKPGQWIADGLKKLILGNKRP